MSQNRFLKGSAALGMAGMFALGGWSAHLVMQPAVAQQPAAAQQQTAVKAVDPAVKAHASALSKAFRNAAEVATPSAVKIHSVTKSKAVRGVTGQRGENPFKGTPFEEMFPQLEQQQNRVPQRDGVGSGVIISSDGIILTNNHVVEGADEVTVQTNDGREFVATDIKTDPESDIAVLRLKNVKDLTPAQLGNSDDLAIGDWVIAIGNPFELETTVSAGIISGKGRELGMIRRSKFLQTDAAINPGNSGGPLVNLDGQVIGINTAIASKTGSYSGIGFAIPMNHAKWVMQQLLDKGSVQRGYLGVGISPVAADVAQKLNIPSHQGLIVGEVVAKSPAADAGLSEGDVILNINGQAVKTPRDLQEVVERTSVDSKIELNLIRDGKPMKVAVTVKPLPEQTAAAARPRISQQGQSTAPKATAAKGYGFSVTDMGNSDTKTFAGMTGVLVSEVDDEGPAMEKGLEAGMLIRKVGKTPVTSVAEFTAALEKETSPDGVIFQVRTANGTRFVVIKPAK
jgi:serine protease Do